MSESTAVATRDQQRKPSAIEQLITGADARAYIEPFLPPGTDITRVAASVMLAMKKDESGMLRKCTPESLVLGVAKIMQWGLEVGTTAYLLPFKNNKSGNVEATPVAGYGGLAELITACSGILLEAQVVRDGDEFQYEYGLTPVLRHVPRAKKGAAITHAYVIMRPPRNGAPTFHVMTAEEIDAIRLQYSKQWKNGALPAWYARKTVVRQAAKLLPKSKEMAAFARVLQEDAEIELEAGPETQRLPAHASADDRPEIDVGDAPEFQDDRDLLED